MAPSVMLKKLSGYRRQNRLHLALQESVRIERTLFTMDWVESPELRRRCQAGLYKGEARHFLAHAIYVHRQGRISDRTFGNQSYRASGLNLVIAAIVYWKSVYMERAVAHLRSTGIAVPDTLLAVGLVAHQPDRQFPLGTGGHRRRAGRVTVCSYFFRVSVFWRTNIEVPPKWSCAAALQDGSTTVRCDKDHLTEPEVFYHLVIGAIVSPL